MEFYYLIICMLLDLKAKEMRKIKIDKYERKQKRNKRGKVVDLTQSIKYRKSSISLLNRVIYNVKKMSKKVELEDFNAYEKEEDCFEET